MKAEVEVRIIDDKGRKLLAQELIEVNHIETYEGSDDDPIKVALDEAVKAHEEI